MTSPLCSHRPPAASSSGSVNQNVRGFAGWLAPRSAVGPARAELANAARDHHVSGVTALEPSDEQAAALVRLLQEAIDGDRYPLSPRVLMLKEILGKLRPEVPRPAASPEPRVSEPPSRGRYRRRR